MRKSSVFLGRREAPLFSRFGAKAIDLVIVAALFLIGRKASLGVGIAAAGLYAGFADCLGDGQSWGKKITGLRVVEESTQLSCSARASVQRNLPLLGLVLSAAHPVLWLFAVFLMIPWGLFETYLCLWLDSAVRHGDVLGNTRVQQAYEWSPVTPSELP